MVFSSEVFLFVFLPAVLAAYTVVRPSWAKNAVLVIASLLFYAWGEARFVGLILGSALVNYGFGLWLSRLPDGLAKQRRALLGIAVAVDLAVLVFFKYSNFLADNWNFALGSRVGREVALSQVYLPLGISFFTFHAISYVVDVYRRTSAARKNPLEVVLYFVFFPQLIAGPIIRYKDIAGQLSRHRVTIDDFAEGVRRFVVGLAKKVLIANVLGSAVDRIFATPPAGIPQWMAWFGIAAYTLQIYFDFSGYSDMAIGLARMFGFRLLENFDFPYVAGSIQEFWRRWHISLSRWFRDYLYVPLGGNRVSPWRVYANLVLVFFLCGLWHGAKWTFVIWGMLHGLFLVLERVGWLRRVTAAPVLRRVYVLAVVAFAWVFFRADSLAYALGYLGALVRPSPGPVLAADVVSHQAMVTLLIGCWFATPVTARAVERARTALLAPARAALVHGAVVACVCALLLLSVAALAAGTYNPFIYFRF